MAMYSKRMISETTRTTNRVITRLVNGDMLTVDIAARRVLLNHDEIKLTEIEFRLLWLLINKAGLLSTYRELLAHGWGDESLASISSLHVHIKHLRDKVRLRGKNGCHITSIRGRGYRFEVNRLTLAD